ncbi:hypothetical protein H4217_005691 [Coemansia sp. RSA 1939]|nr:hypothetical protein H4217_005691 [Coemansia sp. RSA 1939]
MSKSDAEISKLATKLESMLELNDIHSDDEKPNEDGASDREHDEHDVPSNPEPDFGIPRSDSNVSAALYKEEYPPLAVYSPILVEGASSLFSSKISTLDSIVQMVKTGSVSNIVVMAGAGISTSAGIPDFRSPKTGLYANLKEFNLPYAEAIFAMDYFRENPKPFYTLAKELYPGQYSPTTTHFFIKLLESKGLLRRHYTQNIDCLERLAGISHERIVEAHGSFHTAHCIEEACSKEHSREWVKRKIADGETPRCTECGSLVKPDITFFGEELPSRFYELREEDFASCDLLIVMGTSLLVTPFAPQIDEVKANVPRLLINREKAGELADPNLGFKFDREHLSGENADTRGPHRDALILGDCDEACILLADRLGWKDELLELRNEFLSGQNN